jgi:hypothetical protein
MRVHSWRPDFPERCAALTAIRENAVGHVAAASRMEALVAGLVVGGRDVRLFSGVAGALRTLLPHARVPTRMKARDHPKRYAVDDKKEHVGKSPHERTANSFVYRGKL